MNRFQLNNNSPGSTADDPTTDFPPPNAPNQPRSYKCHMALPGSTSNSVSGEFACLLRQRLLVAAVITASGFTVFFIRALISPESFLGFQQWDIVVQGVVAAILVLIATLLGSHLQFRVRQLRILELVLFGGLAAYFTWLQLVIFSDGRILAWAKEEYAGSFLRVANAGNTLRWFALIVIYGTFVPNTWKRCALFVGIWAAIPLSLMTFACTFCPVISPFGFQSVLDMFSLLGIASAIAIFGSYKISHLQQEAMEAKKYGQYYLKELLGSGGMGKVYRAEHALLRRSCAVKLIKPEQLSDNTSLSRFEREVQAMATLTHWNTVAVYDYGLADDGTFYYVMEYLPGLSLQELVDQYGPMSPERTVYFLRQVCDALQEAHSIGVIHRDIKPSNILATERGSIYDVAKLLDFGLVQSIGVSNSDTRLTVQGMILGSPPYMSPEQAQGKESLDARSDIYSLGATAYFLLTGQQMYVRDNPMQILMAHVYDPVQPMIEKQTDIPSDLERIILKCLSKDPKDRYQDAESLAQALAECECAGGWTREDASQWWKNRRQSERQELVAVG